MNCCLLLPRLFCHVIPINREIIHVFGSMSSAIMQWKLQPFLPRHRYWLNQNGRTYIRCLKHAFSRNILANDTLMYIFFVALCLRSTQRGYFRISIVFVIIHDVSHVNIKVKHDIWGGIDSCFFLLDSGWILDIFGMGLEVTNLPCS